MAVSKLEQISDMQGESSMWLCVRGKGETLDCVATSQAVSVRVLLTIRLTFLSLIVAGGIWVSWRSGEPPLCLEDWSYLASATYFAVRCQVHTGKSRHVLHVQRTLSARGISRMPQSRSG